MNQGLQTNDREDIQDRREPSVELDEKPAVGVRQPGPLPHLAPQYDQLLAESRILGFKSALRLERRRQYGQHEPDQRDHATRIADSLTPSTRMRFSVHTGKKFQNQARLKMRGLMRVLLHWAYDSRKI